MEEKHSVQTSPLCSVSATLPSILATRLQISTPVFAALCDNLRVIVVSSLIFHQIAILLKHVFS